MRILLIATMIMGFAPCISQAEDLHSAVINRVSEDHARDVKSGRFERKLSSVEKKSASVRREVHASLGAGKKIEKSQKHVRR